MPIDHEIKLRGFPYPFKAGLAICSDIDYCDRFTFRMVHQFINDRKNGLGLPVADSFFGIGRVSGQMAYFEKDGQTRSKDAELIRRAISGGLIDSIHSWGDFNENLPDPSFVRKIAENLNEDFSRHNLRIKIWINHGDSCNRQNIQARLQPDYTGDVPDSPFYTADLIKAIGVKFYWWSELLPWPLSGKPQNGSPYFWLKLGALTAKNLLHLFARQKINSRRINHILHLMQPNRLKDGSILMGFTRFNKHPGGIWASPTRNTLHHSLRREVLDNLIRRKGYLVLYTHLGLPTNCNGELFLPADKKALIGLAEEYHGGNIWVARTVDILTYLNVIRHLQYDVRKEKEKFIVDIVSLSDPVDGRRVPEETELSWLCFYTSVPEKTSIRLNGRDLKTQVNPPDDTNKKSISLAGKPFPEPESINE